MEVSQPQPRRRPFWLTHADELSVRAIAAVTALMGVINVISAVTPALADRLALLKQYSPLEVRHGSHLAAALAGFALLLLATNLWRRKRMAWLLTLIVLVISIFSHLLKGLDYEEALLAGGLAIWLWVMRAHFHARSDRPSVRQGLRVLIAALGFTLAYGIIGFYLLDRHFSVNFGLGAAARQTVSMFAEFYDPGLQPVTHFGRYFADSIYAVGAVTLSYALFMLVRPVVVREAATPAQRAQAREIVEAHGRSSLARFTLFDDKSYYFSQGGSVIAYVAKGRVALALGDPIGPLCDASAAIVEFKAFCAGNDWQAAFYQAQPDYLDHYQAAGFDALCIGHEGIVKLSEFTLEGKAGKPLRTVDNRFHRLGHRAEMHQPPLAEKLLSELREVSDEWLTTMHGGEKRFSLGWFDDDYVRNSLVMTIRAPDAMITAFANVVPEYQRSEVVVDLMRHRRNVENGTMDFLFASLLEWARQKGYATFNLGLSALSGVGEHSDDPSVARALHFIYQHLDRFYNFKGLHAFKEKFHPEWSPRYLIYPGPTSLLSVGLALVRADSGDDFLDYVRR